MLVNHDGADSAGEFLMGAAAVGRVLSGPGEQIDQLILGEVCVAASCEQSGLQRGASRVKELGMARRHPRMGLMAPCHD